MCVCVSVCVCVCVWCIVHNRYLNCVTPQKNCDESYYCCCEICLGVNTGAPQVTQYCFTTADKRTINKLLRNILLKNKQTLVSSKQHPTMTESGEPNDCMKEEAAQRSKSGGGGH